jgi:hypothetical protein
LLFHPGAQPLTTTGHVGPDVLQPFTGLVYSCQEPWRHIGICSLRYAHVHSQRVKECQQLALLRARQRPVLTDDIGRFARVPQNGVGTRQGKSVVHEP